MNNSINRNNGQWISQIQSNNEEITVLQAQIKIFEKWKEEWRQGRGNAEEADYFYFLFISNYDFICKKIEKNRRYNFGVKKLYLIVIIGVPAIRFLFQIFLGICRGNLLGVIADEDWTDLLANTVTVALAVLLASVVAKWSDIMKYQETWVRHVDHKYKIDREMYFFITNAGDYSEVRTKRRKFIEKVFEIWNENNAKFVKNMEDKEKPLTDTLKIIRGDGD